MTLASPVIANANRSDCGLIWSNSAHFRSGRCGRSRRGGLCLRTLDLGPRRGHRADGVGSPRVLGQHRTARAPEPPTRALRPGLTKRPAPGQPRCPPVHLPGGSPRPPRLAPCTQGVPGDPASSPEDGCPRSHPRGSGPPATPVRVHSRCSDSRRKSTRTRMLRAQAAQAWVPCGPQGCVSDARVTRVPSLRPGLSHGSVWLVPGGLKRKLST